MKTNGYTISVTPIDAYTTYRSAWFNEDGSEREPSDQEQNKDRIYHESLKGKIYLHFLLVDKDYIPSSVSNAILKWEDVAKPDSNRTVISHPLKQMALQSACFDPSKKEEHDAAIAGSFGAIRSALQNHAMTEWDLSGIVEQ